ncbi:MAG: o-succinylbenzoate synthase [Ktedonobacteraceae bacterium]|nr:o-succinylbenzoate synthase [Ktedonobacteraceae bacterium]
MGESRIVSVEAHPYRVPLRGMSTAHGEMRVREGALIELRTSDGLTGWGEMAPLAEFGGGTLPEVLAEFAAFAPRLRDKDLDEALMHLYDQRPALSPVVCGLEIALLDALGQSTEHSVASLLSSYGEETGEARSVVAVNAVCGAASLEAVVEQARAAVAAGFRCIKLKMGGRALYAEIERVAAVRDAIGPAPRLRLDVNEAWTLEQARIVLKDCALHDIQYVEQPLPAADLDGMRELRRVVSIPVAADEALLDLASARRVLAARAADVLVVKPQMAGGLMAGLRMIHEADRAGVRCVVTSSMEAGIGVAGTLHLAAAAPEVTLECGLATLFALEDDLLAQELVVEGGMMAVPEGPGLGVQPDRAALERYRQRG